MNTLIKISITTAALFALAACASDTSTKTTSEATHTASKNDHQHTFRCPMHPEVIGKEGESCPKCGMKLEHNDDATAGSATYFMKFSTTPLAVQPNHDVTLSLTPKKKGSESDQVALDVEHEKKIHLILVSEDLSWFDHIHPEYMQDGSYTVKTKFPSPAKYIAFADYRPTGGSHMVDKQEITVTGTPTAPKSYSSDKLSGTADGYTFELKPTGGKLITGALMHLSGIVKKDGREIDANTLENYLGAKAHFVMISLNEKEYLHVHPSVDKGQFDLHTTFEKPGIYRGWVQFNAEGQLKTIDFTMNVKKGMDEEIKKANQAHTDHHTGSDEHGGH